MLREKTLHHLLLVVARSLEQVPENESHRKVLHESREGLKVTRDGKGSYLVEVRDVNGHKTKIIATSEFRFHERGDIQAQVEKRRGLSDARTHNWERAIKVWQELLDVDLRTTSSLAPGSKHKPKFDRKAAIFIVAISLAVLLFDFIISKSWLTCLFLAWMIPLTRPKGLHLVAASTVITLSLLMHKIDYTYLSLPLVVVAFHLEQLHRSKLSSVWILFVCLVLVFLVPSQLPLFLVVMVFEMLVSLTRLDFRRLSFLAISMMTTTLFLFSASSNITSGNFVGLATIPLALTLIVLVFPHSSESNLIRLSAPLAVSFATVYSDFAIDNALIFLSGWFISFMNSENRKTPVLQVPKIAGITVSIRRNNSTS